MSVTRRGLFRFLAAPAIVSAASLMPVRAIDRLLLPRLWGDGIHDDGIGLQTLIDGGNVFWNNRVIGGGDTGISFHGSTFRIEKCLFVKAGWDVPFHGATLTG